MPVVIFVLKYSVSTPHELGTISGNELAYAFIYNIQPLQVALVLVGLDDPVIHRRNGRAYLVHHTEPAPSGARVNA